MKVISHWYDIAKFILTQIPIVPRDMLWMFVLNVAEGKWLCAPHAPLKFDKLLFPSFTNGNYVSSLSSTTKVSSWTETFCLESFLTVRRKWLTLYSLYPSELLTPGMLHCHSIHSDGNWCHWLICHADQHIQHSGSNRHDVSSGLMPCSGPPPSLLRPLTEVFRVLTQTLAVAGTRGRAGAQ